LVHKRQFFLRERRKTRYTRWILEGEKKGKLKGKGGKKREMAHQKSVAYTAQRGSMSHLVEQRGPKCNLGNPIPVVIPPKGWNNITCFRRKKKES